MAKIKVLLSSRPKLVSEVMRNMIEHQPDMMVVDEVIDPIDLLRVVKTTPVDVIILMPLKSKNEHPKICHHLLAEHPPLKVITLSEKGETGYLYQSDVSRQRIDEPSQNTILCAIRKALQ